MINRPVAVRNACTQSSSTLHTCPTRCIDLFRSEPCNWWYLRADAECVTRWLAARELHPVIHEHKGVHGIYDRMAMTYIKDLCAPVNQHDKFPP